MFCNKRKIIIFSNISVITKTMLSYTNFDLAVIAGLLLLVLLYYHPQKTYQYCFSATPGCFFNSLSNGEYSSLFIVAAFSSKSFSGKISLLVRIHIYLHLLMTKQKS